MKYELTILELGKVLKGLEENFNLKVLVKQTLKGGWITIQGDAEIVDCPKEVKGKCAGGINNVISIKLKENSNEGSLIKIIGAANKKFDVSLDNAKKITVLKGGLALNKVSEEKSESSLKIDKNIVFSIKESVDKVSSIIEKQL